MPFSPANHGAALRTQDHQPFFGTSHEKRCFLDCYAVLPQMLLCLSVSGTLFCRLDKSIRKKCVATSSFPGGRKVDLGRPRSA